MTVCRLRRAAVAMGRRVERVSAIVYVPVAIQQMVRELQVSMVLRRGVRERPKVVLRRRLHLLLQGRVDVMIRCRRCWRSACWQVYLPVRLPVQSANDTCW